MCLYCSQMRWPWMRSSWTCIRTVTESSWCLTSPSSGKTHVSEQLHYSWTDELSICMFPLGVVSITTPLYWALCVSIFTLLSPREILLWRHFISNWSQNVPYMMLNRCGLKLQTSFIGKTDFANCRTFNYILRELPKVPTHVPVCVLGNYRDMGEHRVILPDDIRDLIAGLNRYWNMFIIHSVISYAFLYTYTQLIHLDEQPYQDMNANI